MSTGLFAMPASRHLHPRWNEMARATAGDDLRPIFRARDKVRIPAAIVDAACLSTLLWLVIFSILG